MYDIAIIGAGPAGYVAAIKAVKNKKSVVLIEQNELGGTCLNSGCIPTKTLFYSAKSYLDTKKAHNFGILADNISFDYQKIFQRKETAVKDLKKGLEWLIKKNNITVIKGKASFISNNELLVEKEKIKASHIIIATGSKPKHLSDYALDSKKILDLKTLPKSLAIIGGGYIGAEFASIFNMLKVKITLIESEKNILSGLEESISLSLEENFKKQGIQVIKNVKPHIEDQNTISIENDQIKADIILAAIGRESNYKDLNLEKIGIKTDDKGITVDKTMRTNIENIYAIGDVTGKNMLAHVAYHEAEVALENILKRETFVNYLAIPFVVFTNPQIASCGLSSSKAKKSYDIDIAKFPFMASGWAHTFLKKEGFLQIITDKKTKKILGAQVISEKASDLIPEMTLAIANNLSLEDILKTMHPHPTSSEAWLEAALIANNTSLHV